MIPKHPNPSKKPRLSVTQPSGKPKPLVLVPYRRPKHIAPWPSRKLKPPVLTPYRRLKYFAPRPSGMQRPREPPRMALFKNHMPSLSCDWKSKLLRRRTKVSSTSSPPARLLYEPALWNSAVC